MTESQSENNSNDSEANQVDIGEHSVSSQLTNKTLNSRFATTFLSYALFATVLLIILLVLNDGYFFGSSNRPGFLYALISSTAISCVLYFTESNWTKSCFVDADLPSRYFHIKPKMGKLLFTAILCSYLSTFALSIFILDNTLGETLTAITDPDFLYLVASYSIAIISALYFAPVVVSALTVLGIKLPSFVNKSTIIDFGLEKERSKHTKYRHNYNSVVDDQLQKAMLELPNTTSSTINGLRKRAERLSSINNLILSAIMLVLIAAALFIVYAGEIATKDSQTIRPVHGILQEVDRIEGNIQELELRLTALAAKVGEAIIIESAPEMIAKETSDTSAKRDLVQNNTSSEELPTMSELEAQREVILSQIVRYKNRLELTLELYTKAQAQELVTGANKPDTADTADLLIAAGITRFGVLAITIYLVQILVNLYRYNSKVLGVYLAQADSLMLVGQSAKKIGDLLEKLAPAVEFGKPPSSLPEKVYERFDQMAQSAVANALKKGVTEDTAKS